MMEKLTPYELLNRLSRKRRATLPVFFWAAFMLSACIPVRNVYFEPSGYGGSVKGMVCHGRAGFPGLIEFQRDDVIFLMFASKEHDLLQILIYPPTNVSIAFRLNGFTFASASTEDQNIRPTKIEAYKRGDYFHKWDIPKVEEQILLGKDYKAYHITFSLPTTDLDGFSFRVPTLIINGGEVQLPPVNFKTKSGWFFLPLNC